MFAITQLSHYLLGHATVPGALQAGLLLVMIWLVWVYTTWVTNWLAWMILGGPALALAACAAALVTAVAATDRLPRLPRPAEQPAPPQKRRDT